MRITVGHILEWQDRLDSIKDSQDAIFLDRIRSFICDFRAAHEDDPSAEDVLEGLLSTMW